MDDTKGIVNDDLEIEDDEEVVLDADTMELSPDEDEVPASISEMPFDGNLIPYMDSDEVDKIGSDRKNILDTYKGAREEWENKLLQSIRWLGLAGTDSESPVEGGCEATHPLLLESVVKFQAKAIQEIWPAKGPVRTRVRGRIDAEREARAARVRNYMNYQLMEKLPGFYNNLERNFFRVGFTGVGIRKTGWNGALMAPDPTIVFVENFYIDPSSTDLMTAEEYIEVMQMSSRKKHNLEESGMFAEYEDSSEDVEESLTPSEIESGLAEVQGFDLGVLDRKGFSIGESHCYLDLEGIDPLTDGPAPYIVHFNTSSGRVYSIRRNWRENDPNRIKRIWYTVDHMIPGFGFYSLGYAHLVGDLSASATVILRSLVDAGQYANLQAGFKSKDAKLSNNEPLKFGEFRDVELAPEELKNAFFPLPSKEPSQVLYQMLEFIVKSGQKFADAADEVVNNASNYGPVVTTLALLEASQRFYSSIHKRLHESQKQFFAQIGELNFHNLPDQVEFSTDEENQFVYRTDFDPEAIEILPASDPNALSESQRVARAQIELETAAKYPQLHDMREALWRFYTAMGTENPAKLLTSEDEAISADPLSEIQAAMTGKPIRAQLGQNHQAHIVVKEAFLAQPQMQGTDDPTIAVGKELIKANIAEHKVLIFIAQIGTIAQQQGMPLQDENVQAQVATMMMQMSAASGIQPQLSIEERMVNINERELEVSQERIRSQDIREAAKIAQKNREIDLAEQRFAAETADKTLGRQIEAASKILDNNRQMAQDTAERLNDRAEGVDNVSGNS